jgi:putative membrane protein
MNKYIQFFLRWIACAAGLWIAVRLFGRENTDTTAQTIATFLLAGLIFSIANSLLKPLITTLSLPFVLVTLGLFMLVINGFLVWLAITLSPNLSMGFGWAIISGLIMSLINYLVSGINEFSVFHRKEAK